MVTTYVPEAGDIVYVDFNPTRGHEQARVRPALVLSPKAYNRKTSLVIVCLITSQIKGYPFEVQIDSKSISGVVLADQLRSLDWKARKVKFLTRVSGESLNSVRSKISLLLN